MTAGTFDFTSGIMIIVMVVLLCVLCSGVITVESSPTDDTTPNYSGTGYVDATFGHDGAGILCIHRKDRNTAKAGPIDCFVVPAAGTGAMQELHPLSVCEVDRE